MSATEVDTEPSTSFWWALLSNRGARSTGAIAGILIRHAIPLAGVLFFKWSPQLFLLVTVINFAWNWVLVGIWNSALSASVTGARQGGRSGIGRWAGIALVGLVVFAVVAIGFGFPIFYLWPSKPVVDATWAVGVAGTLVGSLPGAVEQIRVDTRKSLSEKDIDTLAAQRRQLLLVGIIPIVGAYGLLVKFPSDGALVCVTVVYLLFAAICELRPDLAAEFAKELPP